MINNLTNQTEGGGGQSGTIVSKETLELKSKALKGKRKIFLPREEVNDLYDSGMTYKQLAKHYSCSIATIMKHIDKPRTRSETNKMFPRKSQFKKESIPWNKGISCFNGESNPFYECHLTTSLLLIASFLIYSLHYVVFHKKDYFHH